MSAARSVVSTGQPIRSRSAPRERLTRQAGANGELAGERHVDGRSV